MLLRILLHMLVHVTPTFIGWLYQPKLHIKVRLKVSKIKTASVDALICTLKHDIAELPISQGTYNLEYAATLVLQQMHFV